MPTVWYLLCVSKSLLNVLGFDALDAFYTFFIQNSRGSRMPCALFTGIFGTDRVGVFFNSCNHLFVSSANSAQGKLLS